MDVLSQAVLGSSLSQSFADNKSKQLTAMLIGALAGMSPDLDIFIRSASDPLLFLEFHRQFTHSLIFIPFGALVCSIFFYWFVKNKLSFSQVYLFSILGFATHGLLDACTSYGTQLFWPFSDQRVSWNIVSIVDPLFTLPVLIGVGLAVYRGSRLTARVTFVYAILFLSLGLLQKHRAETALINLAHQRGHEVERMLVKPSFGNRLVWKLVYEYKDRYYIDAVKILWGNEIIVGTSIQKLNVTSDFQWLDKNSQQAKDIERFRWFSGNYLAVDTNNKNMIFDVRYSFLPNTAQLMFGIKLDRDADGNQHADFIAKTGLNSKTRKKFLDMLF